MGKPSYIVAKTFLVELRTLRLCDRVVRKLIPYKGPADKKDAYYLQIRKMISHILYSTRSDFEESMAYTRCIPIPYKLGRKYLPDIFIPTKRLGYERGLELLVESGLFKMLDYDRKGKKCRWFGLSSRFIKFLFKVNKKDYLRSTTRLAYLDGPVLKLGKTLDNVLTLAAKKKQQEPCHVLSNNLSKSGREYMAGVYQSLAPIRLNLGKLNLNGFVDKVNTGILLSYLLKVGCTIISKDPFIIEFQPSYEMANLGSRSFEVHGGFQCLSGSIKWSVMTGYNYDIKSSQFNILLRELRANDITVYGFNRLNNDYIKENFPELPEKVYKALRFGSIFNFGAINNSQFSDLFVHLSDTLGQTKAEALLKEWNESLSFVAQKLNKLADIYFARHCKLVNRNKGKYRVKNAVGQFYYFDKKTPAVRRKVMAHILQGIESKAVYDSILNNPGLVCSIEHDGFVSNRPVEWKHDYLKLVKKHEDPIMDSYVLVTRGKLKRLCQELKLNPNDGVPIYRYSASDCIVLAPKGMVGFRIPGVVNSSYAEVITVLACQEYRDRFSAGSAIFS